MLPLHVGLAVNLWLLTSFPFGNSFAIIAIKSSFQRSPPHASSPSSSSSFRLSASSTFDILKDATVTETSTGVQCKALDGIFTQRKDNSKDATNNDAMKFLQTLWNKDSTTTTTQEDSLLYTLVVIMPQLGDFDSAEYAELLAAVEPDLKRAKMALRIIGIGNLASASAFCHFHNLTLSHVYVDETACLHRALQLHGGPDWDVPSWIPDIILEWFVNFVREERDTTTTTTTNNNNKRDVNNAIARAWINYMAMCAGIAAPDTLREILRGYVGDKTAAERIRSDDVVTVGGSNKEDPFIEIIGVSHVKLGPLRYKQRWKDKIGYQRPLELATVRLRVMVEILTNLDVYVPDQRWLHLRGATYLFANNNGIEEDPTLLYEHVDTGVLSYSKTMSRPLSFLEPYIGRERALNPLGLGDAMNE